MRRSTLLSLAFVAVAALPATVFAATPPNVTGLSARFSSGQVSMRWDATGDAGVTQYRIYYGQRSILENGGVYDDFVTTVGAETEFILPQVPPYPQLYLSVLAVNDAGEESPSFVEEIRLDLTAIDAEGQKSQSSDNGLGSPSPSRRTRESSTLGILNAQALSPTSVQLAFNLPVFIPQEQAINAFTVVDGAGKPLGLSRIVIEGSTVTLTTEPQLLGMEYGLRVNEVVQAEPIPGIHLPLDQNRNLISFAGFSGAGAVPPPAAVLPVPAKPAPAPAPVPAAPAEPFLPAVPVSDAVASNGGTLTGSAVTSTKPEGPLTDSGPGVVLAVIAGGAVAGWKKARRTAKN